MIIKQDLIKKIRAYFNMNIYEAKVWLALLSKGTSTAGELAEISGVPRSRTYDVLESLEKQGFAIPKLGKPIKYLAVNPSNILEKLKNNAVKEAEEKTESLVQMKKSTDYDELELLYKTGIKPVKTEELSGAVKGRTNINSQIREMIEDAEKEVIIVTNSKSIEKEARILKPILEKLCKNGISVKLGVDSEETAKRLSKELKAEIKCIKLNARFYIIDGKQILFMLLPETADEEIGVWISTEFFSSALKQLFELAWKEK